MEQTIRILWLSDIHYTDSFQNKENLNRRINLFIDEIDTYLKLLKKNTSDDKLQYFIISGDLAFSGKKEDYELLDKELIAPLQKRFKENQQCPIILCCPGNHDLDRSKKNNFNKFIQLIDNLINKESASADGNITEAELAQNLYEASNERLLDSGNIKSSEEVFNDYCDYAKNLFVTSLKLLDTDQIVSSTYTDSNCLYGYVIDKRNKIIFNVLNSSWFSLGNDFDNLLKVHTEQTGNIDIEKLLAIKKYCNEYGNQIIGLDIINNLQFSKNHEQYPDFYAITIFHHPMNWLKYSHQYDYEKHNKTPLAHLIDLSDILLTGHEHVNVSSTPNILYTNTIHIPGGMFIQDSNNFDKGGQNRFSILEIDKVRKELEVLNFYWGKSEGSDNYKWITHKGDENKWKVKFESKSSYFLESKSLLHTKNEFKKVFNVTRFLNDYILPNATVKKSDCQNDDFSLVYYEDDKKVFLAYVSYKNGVDLFGNSGNSTLFQLCSEFIEDKNYENLEKHLCFLQLDLITEPSIAAEYLSEKKDSGDFILKTDKEIRETYSKILKSSDAKFNKFRSDFFSQFEESKGNIDKFSCYIDVRFGNFIVPFWLVEQYIQ